jgi:hypothetical protein
VDASGEYINGFGVCSVGCSFATVELNLSSTGEFAKAAGFFGEGGLHVTFDYVDGPTEATGIAGRRCLEPSGAGYVFELRESRNLGCAQQCLTY